MRAMRILAITAIAVVAIPQLAVATAATIPEPGMLSTFATAVVAGIIGYRFIRRR